MTEERCEEEGKHGMWTSMGAGVRVAWGAGQDREVIGDVAADNR